MDASKEIDGNDPDRQETQEWVDALKSVVRLHGLGRASFLIRQLEHVLKSPAAWTTSEPTNLHTPYRNSIPPSEQPKYPGDLELERKITNLNRWNAMAMVLRANQKSDGIGGHIASYASAAVLYEVGLNHFFRGDDNNKIADQVFYQGHITPGIYARAFLEGRLSEAHLNNFRRELAPGGGLPSYPHPRLLSDFWQYPTVSMGLSAIMSTYLARFYKYLNYRGLAETKNVKVWNFLGDGEMDEPESLGSLTFASYQELDNLIFVINCNLQKLDGPVRGNGNIITELEGVFRGAGWNVIKVIWDSHWDILFEQDEENVLLDLMANTVDGEYQRLATLEGSEIRSSFFGRSKEALELVEPMSDDAIKNLGRGGHDELKVFSAYQKAVSLQNGKPTVILFKTVKGFGMGDSGEARNIAHQQKKMKLTSIKAFRDRFAIPIGDDELEQLPFYKPKETSPEMKYLRERRLALGGYLPKRRQQSTPLEGVPGEAFYSRFHKGTQGRQVSTTMALVQMLSGLMKTKHFGERIIPIIPDESRTFGMEGLFRQYGIYSNKGQLYEPVDKHSLLPYHESKTGQILEEGITEAGSLSSFIAAGTAYSHMNLPMVPFYFFYSMFGFQRTGDLTWAACDMNCKGFLIGGTAGRTTLNGEGLQHEDGHSHVLATTFPNLQSYDPAYAYEIAVIIEDGIERMYKNGEDVFYYLTVYNENYDQIPMPEGSREGILKGMYKLRSSTKLAKKKGLKVQLLASGVLMNEAKRAADILEKQHDIPCDVWSVTSYKKLREDTLVVERFNRLNPTVSPKTSYLQDVLEGEDGLFLSVSDYMGCLGDMVNPWVPGGIERLGTEGFGRSSSREELRRYFEVDAESMVVCALYGLSKRGLAEPKTVQDAMASMNYDNKKPFAAKVFEQ